MDRLFLDANVIFSAAYKKTSRVRWLWDIGDVELVSSYYVVEEAKQNVWKERPESLSELEVLVSKMTISGGTAASDDLPEDIDLHIKDRPVLAAAIEAQASHLLTGNTRHFDHLFWKEVAGVMILTPAMYRHKREGRHN
ncbi:MAG: hypothetical protein HYX78_04650 [Armatimonadetes bacterium]|nr:hypothetical protein [Armatimonadota bacterium]